MFGAVTVRQFLVVASLGVASLTTAFAAEMVSIKGSIVNMRSGPSTRTEALWELKKGYPLKVLKRKGSWIQVQDFENDRGWVSRKLDGQNAVPRGQVQHGQYSQWPQHQIPHRGQGRARRCAAYPGQKVRLGEGAAQQWQVGLGVRQTDLGLVSRLETAQALRVRLARLEAIHAMSEERMASSTVMSIGSAQLRGTNTV